MSKARKNHPFGIVPAPTQRERLDQVAAFRTAYNDAVEAAVEANDLKSLTFLSIDIHNIKDITIRIERCVTIVEKHSKRG